MSTTNNQEPEKNDKIAEQSELDHEVAEPEINRVLERSYTLLESGMSSSSSPIP